MTTQQLLTANQSSNVGFLQSGAGALPRTAESKLRDVVSVMDFGAVGDGVTDDTAAIQAALNSGNGLVFVPSGDYKVSAPLSIPSDTRIYGNGPSSRIFTTNTSNGVYSWGNTGLVIFVLDQVTNVCIDNLCMDTSGITNFTFASRNITAWGCSNVWVTNNKFLTCGGASAFINCSQYFIADNNIYVDPTDNDSHHDGIIDQWWGSGDFVISGNTIRGRIPVVVQYGILVTGAQTNGVTPSACSRFSIIGNRVYNCEQVGIRSQGETGNNYDCVIANNVIDTVSNFFGIDIGNTINATVSGNTVRNTYFSGIKVAGTGAGSSNVSIVGNALYNVVTSASTIDTDAAISCKESARCIVSGNTISGNTHPLAVHFSANCANSNEFANQYGEPTKYPSVKSNNSSSIVSYGEYLMTRTPVTNVSSVVYGDANYSVSGRVVTVSFEVGVVTPGAGNTVLGLGLPFASNFTAKTNAVGSCSTTAGVAASLFADTTNDRVELTFNAPGSGTYVFYGTFQYVLK